MTPGAISPQRSGVWDSFLVILEMDRASGAYELVYSTYFGGEKSEEIGGAARFDAAGNLFVGASVRLTTSGGRGKKNQPEPDFPLMGNPQIKTGPQDARDGYLSIFAPSVNGTKPERVCAPALKKSFGRFLIN